MERKTISWFFEAQRMQHKKCNTELSVDIIRQQLYLTLFCGWQAMCYRIQQPGRFQILPSQKEIPARGTWHYNC